MRLFRILFLVLIAVSPTAFLKAQQQGPPSSTQREFVPRGIEELRQGASSKTEFTLDHSMLILASKLDPNNEDLQRVIAGASGLSVHDFRYARPATFDAQAVEAGRDDYREAGWKQLMNKYERNGGPGVTDLWVRLENNAISNIAILVARANEVDLFVVSGSISPIDLTQRSRRQKHCAWY